MYLRCASICTQTAYLIFDIQPVDGLPDPDQCDLIRSIPAETAHTLSHGSSQHSMIRVHILRSGGVTYSVKLPDSRSRSDREYGPVGSLFLFPYFLTTAPVLTCAEDIHLILSCRYNLQRKTSSNSCHLPYCPALAFTQYDPFGHSYSVMLDLCISML